MPRNLIECNKKTEILAALQRGLATIHDGRRYQNELVQLCSLTWKTPALHVRACGCQHRMRREFVHALRTAVHVWPVATASTTTARTYVPFRPRRISCMNLYSAVVLHTVPWYGVRPSWASLTPPTAMSRKQSHGRSSRAIYFFNTEKKRRGLLPSFLPHHDNDCAVRRWFRGPLI